MLNARGGIECDFTVARLAEERFSIVTGTAFGNHDREWIRRHAAGRPGVAVRDVTSQWACIGLWGPRARDLLQPLTTQDLSNDAFPYMTVRDTTVGHVPVRALRVTYVGELGWELYCPAEYGLGLWGTLWAAGRPLGVTAGGYRAIDSLRLEKGYRVWGADITPDETPDEGGVGFCVKLDKEFVGRDSVVAARERGPRSALCCVLLERPTLCGTRQRAGPGGRRDRRARDHRRLRVHGGSLDRLRLPASRARRAGHRRGDRDIRPLGRWRGCARAAVRSERRAHPGVSDAPYDEAYDGRGEPRPLYRDLLARLDDPCALAARTKAALRGRKLPSTPRPTGSLPSIPSARLLDEDEWSGLRRGIEQRLRALEAFLCDVYGDARIVEAGVVPAAVVESSPHFEASMRGAPDRRWISVAGLDLVRGPDGRFLVLEDQLRMPAGLAYAVVAREAMRELLPVAPPQADHSRVFGELALALRDAAPEGTAEPNAVLLCEGRRAAGWWEHERLARELCAPMVTLADLDHRDDRLVAWIDGRTRAVDVVYHRTDEDHFSGTALGDALLEPCRAGRLACVNAIGSGLADDKLVHAYVEEMIRFYLGEEPFLRSVVTHGLDEPSVLDRLDGLVVKPRGEMGGEGVVIWRDADSETRKRERGRIDRDPQQFVAQELVTLSVHPTVRGERLEPRHVDLRPYAVVDDAGVHLLPGGLSRVALERGSMIVNSGRGGGVKDTWASS